MVSDTRSSRKVKEADGNSSKKNINVRKDSPLRRSVEANVSGVRRSARETSSSRQMTPSPQSMRKSKRLDKGMPPLTPPVKRKSERLEKYSTPSSLRRSDRTELDPEAVGKKRKKMNARTFKALFKRQRIEEIMPDGDGKLEEQDTLHHICSDDGRGIGSEPTGNGLILKGSHADKNSGVNVDSSLRDNVSDEPSQKNSQSSSGVRETFLYSERSPTIFSSTKNVDAPESESSTCLGRSRDCSGSSDSSEKYLHPKEGTLSSLAKCENCNLMGTCVLCSKHRRVGYDSPEQELCSCSSMVHSELGSFCTCKDRNDHGARLHQNLLKDPTADTYWWRSVEILKWMVVEMCVHYATKMASSCGFYTSHAFADCEVEGRLDCAGSFVRERPIKDKVYIASSAVISVCNFEWLVKWRGLSYEHATWELDNASFLSSSLGQNLMKNYEIRHRKAKLQVNQGDKGSISKLPELPVSGSHVNDNVLKNVNKLRECLFKCQNAVIFDDQERAMTVTSFIESMNESTRPFLIVTASGSLSQWEAEFAQLVPSVDVVVYNGNKDTRKGIRASEFYEEGGQVMLQVLLSSAEAVLEDLDILGSIRWEAL
ncbi:UNVERIFIED_CONTAM: protein let [Sesamum radiatum]|uniref:Protein let n=1 Tax=Sesamum radiatum TaxID=300843 RepID=A0AAW2UB09_SESRA